MIGDDTESIFIRKGDNGELLVAGEPPGEPKQVEDFHVIVSQFGRQRYISVYIAGAARQGSVSAQLLALAF